MQLSGDLPPDSLYSTEKSAFFPASQYNPKHCNYTEPELSGL
jgi:hypothetical protein